MDKLLQKIVDRAVEETRSSYEFTATNAKGDSPIERALFTAIILYVDQRHRCFDEVMAPRDARIASAMMADSRYHFSLILQSQVQLQDWRVDFLLSAYSHDRGSWQQMIIECDGHDFHERTKEQAARDRERDRRFQELGYRVYRFTGSEIWRDPWLCAEKIIDWAEAYV